MQNKLTLLALAACLLIWSSTFVVIKFALLKYSPESITLLRFFIASCIMLIYCFKDKEFLWQLNLQDLFLCFLVGATLAGYLVGVSFGIITLPCALTSFIVSTEPIMIAIIAAIFLKEELSVLAGLGAVISLIGLSVIFFKNYHPGAIAFNSSFVIVVLATLSSSLYCIFQKPLLLKYKTKHIVAWYMWFATLVLIPNVPHVLMDVRQAYWQADVSVLYLAIFPTLIASLLWTFAISKIPVSLASCMFYLIPFATLIMSYIWLNEKISGWEFFGGCLTVLGAIVISLHSIKRTLLKG